MGKIYLVRHGQSADNAAGVLGGRRDSELTALGRQQAQTAAEKLYELALGVEVIYSSPLLRAFETARIIAGKLALPEIVTDDRLMERDFGILAGRPYADIPSYSHQIIRQGQESYFLDAPGAEDFPALYARSAELLAEIERVHGQACVLLVTHEGVGKMIRAAYSHLSWEQGLETPNFRNAEIVEL